MDPKSAGGVPTAPTLSVNVDSDYLLRAWLDAVASTSPGVPGLEGLLEERLSALAAAGQMDEASLLLVAQDAAQLALEVRSAEEARALSKRLRRAVYEFLLAIDAAADVASLTGEVAPVLPAATIPEPDGAVETAIGDQVVAPPDGAEQVPAEPVAVAPSEDVPEVVAVDEPSLSAEAVAPAELEIERLVLAVPISADDAEAWSGAAATTAEALVEDGTIVFTTVVPPAPAEPEPPTAAPEDPQAAVEPEIATQELGPAPGEPAAVEPELVAAADASPQAIADVAAEDGTAIEQEADAPHEALRVPPLFRRLRPSFRQRVEVPQEESFLSAAAAALGETSSETVPSEPVPQATDAGAAAAVLPPVETAPPAPARQPAAAAPPPAESLELPPSPPPVAAQPVAPPVAAPPPPAAAPVSPPPVQEPAATFEPSAPAVLPAAPTPPLPSVPATAEAVPDAGPQPTPRVAPETFHAEPLPPVVREWPASDVDSDAAFHLTEPPELRRGAHSTREDSTPPPAQPQPAWGLRQSPRQQLLAERMAQKRRQEAVRVALEAAQLAAALAEPETKRKGRRSEPPRLPDVAGVRTLVEEQLKKKRGAEAGALLQRAAQEQGGREIADLAIDSGDRCIALGQSRAAANCFLASWRADPIYEAPLWRLADLCLAERDIELAVGYLERIALLMRSRGDDEGAVGVYRKIVTVAPERSDIRDLLRLAQTTGQLE